MKPLAKFFLALLFTTWANFAAAQDVEMADTFRADGKIYVVVAIIMVVLVGLVAYLFILDRKMTKLERMIGSRKQTKSDGKSF